MKYKYSLSFIFLFTFTMLSACSHTTHVAATNDGKTAWITHDYMFLFFINSQKFFCSKGDTKSDRPVCLKAIEKPF